MTSRNCKKVPTLAGMFFGWTPEIKMQTREYQACMAKRKAANDRAKQLGFAGSRDPRYAQYLDEDARKKRAQKLKNTMESEAKNRVACDLCTKAWIAQHGAPYKGNTEYNNYYHSNYTCKACSHNVRQLANRN